MSPIDLTAIPQVATRFQNEDHHVEADLLNRTVAALDAGASDLGALLQQLATHTREHFEREDQAMQRTGFPPYPMHHAEHERVLAELAGFVARYQADGDAPALRQYLAHDVPTWFVSHIQTMDFITARWVAQHEG